MYTPSNFNNNSIATTFAVMSSGALGNPGVGNGYGVRPVVNLNTENLTFTGTGTMQDPYVVS